MTREKIMKMLNNTAMLTIIAMVIGAGLGMVFGETMQSINFIGTIWLYCIQMVVVPLILCMMIIAIGKQKDAATLGRIAARIIGYYLITTIIACVIGLSVALIIKPGQGLSLDGFVVSDVASSSAITVSSFMLSLFSSNMFSSFTDGNILQTMVIGIFLGLSILAMKNQERKDTLLNFFESVNDMIFAYIKVVMKLAPIGVLCLMANTFGTYGLTILTAMAQLIGTYWLSVIIHVLLTYGIAMWAFGRVNPFTFLKKSAPVWTFTVASCSSTASIPVSIKTAKENFSIPERVANFCIPLGSQMNTDGTAIMFTGVLIFIGQIAGIDYSVPMLIQMVLVGALLSSAGGGIPGGGVVKLLIIVEAFGLPVALVGVIAGFYRLFDMGTTTCNCLGDLAGTVCVTNSEKRRAERLGIPFEEA